MTDFVALLSAVESAAPDDPTPLLVAADWCDEDGKPMVAYTLRWCAARKRRPYRRPDVLRRPWQWVREQHRYPQFTRAELIARSAAVIPSTVFGAVPWPAPRHHGTFFHVFPTAREAYYWLADAVAKLLADVGHPDLPPPAPRRPAAVELVVCVGCGTARDARNESCRVCGATTPREAP